MTFPIFSPFTEIDLSVTEQDVIKTHLSTPEVKKYFLLLSNNLGKDLLSTTNLQELPSEQLMRKHLFVKAQLELLQTLYEL